MSLLINPLTTYIKRSAVVSASLIKNRHKKLKIGFMSNVAKCNFGKYNAIGNYVMLSNVTLGDATYIADDSMIMNTKIGKFCSIAPRVKCGLGRHPSKDFVTTHPAFFSLRGQTLLVLTKEQRFEEIEEITIGNDVWIGSDAIILDGVNIGDGAIVGAGAVVTKDVLPYTIVGGIPAKPIRKRFEQSEIDYLLKFSWWNKDIKWLKENAEKFSDIKKFIKNTEEKEKIKSVTIVTPSYNQGQFIEKTIQSVWSQKGNFELEHIIADGGSTDNTIEIIKKYEKLYKSKKYPFKCNKFTFIWWSKKDKGQTDALNKSFNKAKGDVVNWINSDDVFCSDKALQLIMTTFNKVETDIVIGRGKLIDEKDRAFGEAGLLSKISTNDEFQKKLKDLKKGIFLMQQSLFFKRFLLKKCPLDVNLHYHMDWDLYLKFYFSGAHFYFINKYIGAIREHPDAKTVILPKRIYQERWNIYKKNHLWSAGRIHTVIKVWVYNIKPLSKLLDYSLIVIRTVMPFYNNRKITNK